MKKVVRDIVLQQEELVRDIRIIALNHSRSVQVEDPEDRAKISDVAEFHNRERMFRLMDLVFYEVAEMLQPFSASWDKEIKELVSDEYREPKCYHIHLHVPEKFPHATYMYLKDLAHEFIVNKVLYGYLRVAYPESAPYFLDVANSLEDNIRELAGKQYGIVYRPLQPF